MLEKSIAKLMKEVGAKSDELLDHDDQIHDQEDTMAQLREVKKSLPQYAIKDMAAIRRRESVIMDRNLLLFHPNNKLDKD